MTDRLPSLNALRAFEAVARHRSIRRAAAELHVTPAAVSQQIRALEDDLGAPLFLRTPRGLVPTPPAEAGLAELRGAFDGLARGVRRMRQSRRRRLAVGVDPSLAATWLIARLDRFKARHPDIDLLIEASGARADFARQELDLAIRYGAGDEPGCRADRLFEEEVFPVCSPAFLAGPPPLREPADLRHRTLLHLEWSPAYGEWPDWAAWLRAVGVEGVEASRGPRFTEHAMVLKAAAEGQGVALGCTSLVADDLAAGRLVWPFDICMPVRFAYHLLCPAGAAGDPAVAAFREWLLAEARGAAAEAAA